MLGEDYGRFVAKGYVKNGTQEWLRWSEVSGGGPQRRARYLDRLLVLEGTPLSTQL